MTPAQLLTTTPRDFLAIAQGKIKQQRRKREFMDILNARNISKMVNVHCGTEANPCPTQPSDFLCLKHEDEQPDTAEDIHNEMQGWAEMSTNGR